MLLLQWVTLGKVRMRLLLSAASPVRTTMTESGSEWPISSLNTTWKQNHSITPKIPDQGSWTLSVCELTPAGICFQDSSILYKNMAHILLHLSCPGLFGSLKEQKSGQTVPNMNNHWARALLGVSGTASTLWQQKRGKSLGEGCYWRVNLLQSTEVEFLSIVRLSKFRKNNFPCDWGSHERRQKKLCTAKAIGTCLRTLFITSFWLQSSSCFFRMEKR